MHLFLLEKYKIAVFWSPRCCHKSLNHFLLKNNLVEDVKTLGNSTHCWNQYKIEDLKDYKQVLIARNPYKRFYSFIRWINWFFSGEQTNPKKYIMELLTVLKMKPEYIIRYHEPHHASPQCSQAWSLVDKDNIKVFDITEFDKFQEYIGLLSNEDFQKIEEIPKENCNNIYDFFEKDKEILDLYEEVFKEDIEQLKLLGINTDRCLVG